jgi:arylsulfatase A-like enzyme
VRIQVAPYAAICVLLVSSGIAEAAEERPSIVLIMSDDMGFSDIGCYGGEIDTPNLDRLAAGGIRFAQFYNTGRCCPTRASLLTGLYPHQAEIGHMMDDRNLPGYRGDLGHHCPTIAEVLGTAGYSTYMAGKWHVTKKVRPEGEADRHNWPLQRGFDRFYGTIHGAGSFFDPNSLVRGNTLISPCADPEYQTETFYYTDAISDHAARFIREHDQSEPFFIYVAFTAAHWPMHALPEDIEKYRGKYDEPYAHYREQRLKRMQEMGIIDSAWSMSPRDSSGDVGGEHLDWERRCMEVYAAMVDRMDQGIGKIVAALEDTGQADNTLVLFLQDNGGCAEGMGRGSKVSYRDENPEELEPMSAEELQPDMIPRRTRDGRVLRQGRDVMPGPADTYHGYGRSWANVSNTPFRRYKHWVHEGGISTPLIAHWPEGIDASRRGSLEHQPGHLIDLMATCADLAGAEYPDRFGGEEIVPLEGVSLTPAFSGEKLGRSAPIFFEHEGNRALRAGRWKLVARGALGPWELYDIDTDRTESTDLSAKESERAEELAERWEAMARRVNAKPWPWKR